MPERWADYLVSAVRFNPSGTHIRAAHVHRDDGAIGSPVVITRLRLLHALRSGTSFATIHQKPGETGGQWVRGPGVRLVEVDGIEYLRIDANQARADDLGGLPEF